MATEDTAANEWMHINGTLRELEIQNLHDFVYIVLWILQREPDAVVPSVKAVNHRLVSHCFLAI